VNAIVSYIDATGTIEGAPGIKPEHLPVFDCSFKPAKGTRSIHYMGHIKMMAAAQPFLSGAISKTVNLPHEATIEEVARPMRELAAGHQSGGHLPRRLQGNAAAEHEHGREEGTSALDSRGQPRAQPPVPVATRCRSRSEGARAHATGKLEVNAKQLLVAAQAFEKSLEEIATAAAFPCDGYAFGRCGNGR